jgi:hypothetical protein
MISITALKLFFFLIAIFNVLAVDKILMRQNLMRKKMVKRYWIERIKII